MELPLLTDSGTANTVVLVAEPAAAATVTDVAATVAHVNAPTANNNTIDARGPTIAHYQPAKMFVTPHESSLTSRYGLVTFPPARYRWGVDGGLVDRGRTRSDFSCGWKKTRVAVKYSSDRRRNAEKKQSIN